MKSLQELLKEEKKLVLPAFNESIARQLGELATDMAVQKNLSVAIRVEREGQILYQISLPGTTIDNDLWLSGKARIVHHFLHSSFYISRKMIEAGTSLADKSLLDPVLYRDKGGAVPLFVKNGGLAGVLIVSGLPDHEDHDFSIEIVNEYIKRQNTNFSDKG
ncbi:heme-binding protein [Oceanispirochaeta sp.]|jgi:uncharacterized protein (UPF0303 family)|uniref:heme-degrading domain-containing protein n=1 Tax=Oceanispirochaeta sp. TaxID=2035350 RepID=UPI002608AB0B|nr:heme-binding protein [Oceanispirochaeta sp.]MDA3958595.1 heme-binding protein [Oceanispirochaeta sp.]